MFAETTDRPDGDERYIAATNSSNLRLNPDTLCDATHLIAAGLAGNRMADALNHLRSEWDSAAKPAKWTDADVHARAKTLPAKKKGKPDLHMARTQLIVQHASAMRAAYMRLVGRALCLELLAEWAVMRGVDPDLLSPALYHWLTPTCPVCDGRGHMRHPDAPVLGKVCVHCGGAGTWPKPQGAIQVQEYMERCVGKASQERKNLLAGR